MPQEFTAKFKVDITDLKRNISNAQKAIKEANATFKANTAGMDRWSDNADGLTEKLSQLDKILSNQKTILASYKSELTKQKEAYAENSKRAEELKKKLQELASQGVDKASEEYKQYKRALQNVLKEQENNEKAADDLKITILNQEAAVKNTEKEIRHYKDSLDHLDDATEEVTKDTKDANEGFTVMKGVLADLASSAIKKAISGLKNLGKAAIEAYKDYDKGADNIIKATGATGDAAKELEESYKNVNKKVVGDFDNIGSAMGEVNTRFGFTGEKLEDASEQFLKFAEITGSDATQAVQLVSRAMGDAGIDADNYAEVLDDLATASQKSGISVDELASLLTSYGAPMRALGFDTKESIAIFSGWEKAGVNTKTAFSGMKTAIGKWSKEGKDAKKEFQKVLKEIAAAPNIAEATGKAIEAFGQKAGPDLADAIQGGRFEYSDFLDLLKDSKGTVKNTYEATQDGFDKIKLVIQGAKTELGSYVSDMAKKYAPQIEEFAGKVVEGLKKAIKWVAENSKVVAGFATVIAGAFAITKIANFVSAISKTVSVFASVGKAIGGVTSATKLLNAAFVASPLGLVISAVVGLSGAFIALRKAQEKEIEAQYGLNDAQKKTVEKAAEIKQSYDDIDTARKNSMQAVDSEFGYLKELKEEYNKLLDKNGKVKKGYEERAEFILTKLSESLGVERSEIEKVIEKNGELGKSIDDLIVKKQAEATLAANEAAYTEAIQNRNEALKTYMKSQEVVKEAEEKYNATLKETNEERQRIMNTVASTNESLDKYAYELGQIDKKEKTAKKALEDAKKAVEDSEGAYVGYISTLQNYEGLSGAILSGDAKAIDEAMTAIQNSLVTAETGTKNTLEKQLENSKKTYEEMKAAAEKQTPGITAAVVKNAEEMVKRSEAELEKYKKAHKDSFNALLTEAGKTKEQMATAGAGVGHAFWTNVESGENIKGAGDAGAALKNAAVSASSDSSGMVTNGENAGQGFVNGLRSKIKDIVAAAAEASQRAAAAAANAQQSASPSKLWRDEIGAMAGEGYIEGLASKMKTAAKTAKDFVLGAAKSAENNGKWGDFGSALRGGISGVSGSISGTAGSVGGKTMVYNQTINSPKALSRIELYRQTKNLLELAKMGA